MITPASLRVDYPEFANTQTYPDSQANYWLAVARLLLNQDRWGPPSLKATNPPTAMYDIATELFAAHNMVLEARALAEAKRGGIPGITQGPVSAKSVGPVSVSYDTAASITTDAGHWNETIYGRRYINLVLMFGAGPIQVGPSFNGAALMNLVPMGPPWWGAQVDLGIGPD